MKNHIILTVAVFIISFNSCNSKKVLKEDIVIKDNLKVLKINGLDEIGSIYLSELVNDYTITQLTENNYPIISQLRQLFVSEENNRAFIVDEYSVNIFDLEGKYIKTIKSIGDSYSEYHRIFAADLDPANGDVYIYDQGMAKVLKFDMNGNYQSYVKFDFLPYVSFAHLNNGRYSFNFGNNENIAGLRKNLVIVDSLSTIERAYIPQVKNVQVSWYDYHRSDNYLNYSQFLNDTIYGFSDSNELIAKYAIDFQDYKMPILEGETNAQEFFFGGKYAKYAQSISSIVENDKLLMFGFSIEGRGTRAMYDKPNSCINVGYLKDDVGLGVVFSKLFITDKYLYGLSTCTGLNTVNNIISSNLSTKDYEDYKLKNQNIIDYVDYCSSADPEAPFLVKMTLRDKYAVQ